METERKVHACDSYLDVHLFLTIGKTFLDRQGHSFYAASLTIKFVLSPPLSSDPIDPTRRLSVHVLVARDEPQTVQVGQTDRTSAGAMSQAAPMMGAVD